MAHSDGLPQTGDAQEIGQDATSCLWANKPRNWYLKDLGGTDDYGLDFQVQISVNQSVQDIFRIQLKGTRSPNLILDRSYFSIPLMASTLRYYDKIVEPILLVYCDLSVNLDDPNKCPMYYTWVRPELRRIKIDKIPIAQGTVNLRIPVANTLTNKTDLLNELRQANALANIGHALDVKVENDRPGLNIEERVDLLLDVQTGLIARSPDLLDALAAPPTESWVEPKRGTLAWHLREAGRHIKIGKTERCKNELASAAKFFESATSIEKAEFCNISGRVKSLEGDNQGARDAYLDATKFDSQPKYWTVWAESELQLRYKLGDKNDFSDILVLLHGDHPSILGIKARLLAAENKYEESIALLNTFSGVESLSARAIVETMNSKPAETFHACEEGLAIDGIPDSSRQLFSLLKARARFTLAIGKSRIPLLGEIIPPAGLPGMDIELLRLAWGDIQEAVDLIQEAGWTSNIDLLSDIWAATASMFGKQREVFPQIVEAANARPHFEGLQTSAEIIAAQCGEFNVALEINNRTSDSGIKWLRRTAYLHELNHHRDCANLFEQHVNHVDRKHQLFGIVLSMAILSANKIVKTDLANQWYEIFYSDPELAPDKAVFDYQSTTEENKLTKPEALEKLYAQFFALGKPNQIAIFLFMELDPTDNVQAIKCIEIADCIRASNILPSVAAIHLAMALITTKRWSELLELSRESGRQFQGINRLMAFEGLALDRLGMVDDARRLLARMIDEGKSDSVALKTYVNIMVRGGFAEEAIETAEKIFESASDASQKMECILLLFKLEQSKNPLSLRLMDLAIRMGELVNPSIEQQEALFLTMMLTGTLSRNVPPTQEAIQTFRTRSEAFFLNFPHSKMLAKAEVSNDATPDELLKTIQEIAGLDDACIAHYTKLENQLQAGTLPFPYAWRPRHILRNIRDVVHLWEITKKSNADDQKYHLQMMAVQWTPRPALATRNLIPMIDLTTLLVIFDLNLFEHVFSFFPKIAISKATLTDLSKLAQPFSGSLWFSKCKDLQDRLKEHYEQILQPGWEPTEDNTQRLDFSSEEIKQLCATGDYTLYSDDIIFRLYCTGDDVEKQGICTGDILNGLEEIGVLTTVEVAEMYAKLCSWHVGLTINYRYQMAVVPDSLKMIGSVAKGVALLQNSNAFMSMATAIWDFRSDFTKNASHIAHVLSVMIEDARLSTTSIASILGVWYVKAKLRSDTPNPPINILIIIIPYAAALCTQISAHEMQRLWSVFLSLVEFEHGDRMDEQKERDAIRLIAQKCAELDTKVENTPGASFSERLAIGLPSGTANADIFSEASVLAKVQINLNTGCF